jgi:hypothetical protein
LIGMASFIKNIFGVLVLLLQACALQGPVSKPLSAGEPTRDEYLFSRLFFAGNAPWSSMNVVESLRDPVWVKGWTRTALILQDGREVVLLERGDLRAFSVELAEVTGAGVEISDGDVIGMVRVHHWCGNDPVRGHDARISVPDLLRYLSTKSPARLSDGESPVMVRRFSSRAGWDVDSFHSFRDWQGKNSALASPRAICCARERSPSGPDGAATYLAVFEDGAYLYARGSFDGGPRKKVTVWSDWLPDGAVSKLKSSLPLSPEDRDPLELDPAALNDPCSAAFQPLFLLLRARHRE